MINPSIVSGRTINSIDIAPFDIPQSQHGLLKGAIHVTFGASAGPSEVADGTLVCGAASTCRRGPLWVKALSRSRDSPLKRGAEDADGELGNRYV